MDRRAAAARRADHQYRRHDGTLDERPLALDVASRRQSAGCRRGDEPAAVDRLLLPPQLRRRDTLPRKLHERPAAAALPPDSRRRAHADENGHAMTTIAVALACWVSGLRVA